MLGSNTETSDQLRVTAGSAGDLPLSASHSTLLYFIVSRWLVGLMSQRWPFLLCCVLPPVAVLLNMTFLKALFNHRWFVVDQANCSIAFTAPAAKLAALDARREYTVF